MQPHRKPLKEKSHDQSHKEMHEMNGAPKKKKSDVQSDGAL